MVPIRVTPSTWLWNAAWGIAITSTVIAGLKAKGWDHDACWQAAVGWWWGLIDVFLFRVNVCIQIDGSAHIRTTHGKPPAATRRTDIKCCLAAWEWKGTVPPALVRVQSNDVHNLAFLQAAVAVAANKRCIVLSPSYNRVRWQIADGWLHLVDELAALLSGCTKYVDACGNHVFCRAL